MHDSPDSMETVKTFGPEVAFCRANEVVRYNPESDVVTVHDFALVEQVLAVEFTADGRCVSAVLLCL